MADRTTPKQAAQVAPERGRDCCHSWTRSQDARAIFTRFSALHLLPTHPCTALPLQKDLLHHDFQQQRRAHVTFRHVGEAISLPRALISCTASSLTCCGEDKRSASGGASAEVVRLLLARVSRKSPVGMHVLSPQRLAQFKISGVGVGDGAGGGRTADAVWFGGGRTPLQSRRPKMGGNRKRGGRSRGQGGLGWEGGPVDP